MVNDKLMRVFNEEEVENERKKEVKKKKQMYSTIKINRHYKELFDELVHQHRTKQVDFIEMLLEDWCKHQDQDIYKQFLNNELPGQKK